MPQKGVKVALSFNPAILRWARERLRLVPEDVARQVPVAPENIIAWEHGAASPTVRQAQALAEIYDRPFLEFFAPAVPKLDPLELAPDYRFHRQPPSDIELTALEGVQAWAESQRLNAIDLYQELGETPPLVPPNLHTAIDDDPEAAAIAARNIVDLPIKRQLSLKSTERDKFPVMLRNALERAGVLVLK
jgi:transcriptional regulator with XRE-family HTH domain